MLPPQSKIQTETTALQPKTPKGTHLILLSLAGLATAAGITACRLLLSETGTVLLLLSTDGIDKLHGDYVVDYELTHQCTKNFSAGLAKFMIAMGSSPYVRSVPLIIVFLSSAALMVGVVLFHNELCRYASQLEPIFGKDWNEFTCKVNAYFLDGREMLKQRIEKTVESIDSVVADDLIRMIVKTGNEMMSCVAGGLFLYSLPDQVVPQVILSSGEGGEALVRMQNSRRRVINAMDPSLDDILFRPGGLWSIIPGLRDYLIGLTKNSVTEKRFDAIVDAPTVDSTANDSGSHEEDKMVTSNRSLPTLIHVQQPEKDGNEVLSPPEESTIMIKSGETVAEALTATLRDALTSSCTNINETEQQQRKTPSQSIQLKKALQHISTMATFCFILHLHKSPSTRKTWRSALHFFTSCGLLTTAISTGLASTLSSIYDEKSIVGAACLKAMGGISMFPNAKISEVLNKVRCVVKSNRRLQMALALTVMYGLKKSHVGLRRTKVGGRH